MKKFNITQLYNLYKKEYDKALKSVRRMTGRDMYAPKLTKAQFKARAKAALNSGVKVNSKYVHLFVDASKYEITKKAAKVRAEALLKKTGKKFSEVSIRRHTNKDLVKAWDDLEALRQALIAKGLSSLAASKLIAISYFGSK